MQKLTAGKETMTMILLNTAESVRDRFPSPLQKPSGTQEKQPSCPLCGGRRVVEVNRTGLAGESEWKRCKACKGKKR